MLRLVATAVLAAAGAGCALGGAGHAAGPTSNPGPAGDPTAPRAGASAEFDYDWSVRRIGGGELELAALRGRTLVVNFWASWCPPCIRELASFEGLMQSVEARGIDVTFLFVSPEELDVATDFVEDNGWELPFAVEVRRAPPSLGDLVLPTTFVVDPAGGIALRHRGATDWNQPEVIDLLDSLDGSGPAPGRPAGGSSS